MKKTTSAPRNVRIFSVNNGNSPGFHIYLDFSGERVPLMHHRHNGLLYPLLKDGVRLEELRRWRPKGSSSHSDRHRRNQRRRETKLEGMITYLLEVIDDEIQARTIAEKAQPERMPQPLRRDGASLTRAA